MMRAAWKALHRRKEYSFSGFINIFLPFVCKGFCKNALGKEAGKKVMTMKARCANRPVEFWKGKGHVKNFTLWEELLEDKETLIKEASK